MVPAGRGDIGVAVVHRHLVPAPPQARPKSEPADASSYHRNLHSQPPYLVSGFLVLDFLVSGRL
ncbi:hypothetical protein GCM10009804_28480 [Kribbella hippodromi]|uniref:Uncharacterized protein n=1 Tax=Kribbella hippodromi TaxID=434347 RepID=A0ABP4P4W2_9ACTN